MTASLLAPAVAEPGQNIRIDGAGLDQTVKFNLETVDAHGDPIGQLTNINRPDPNGTFHCGIRVPPIIGPSKIRVYQRGVVVAEAPVQVQLVAPPPPPANTRIFTGTVSGDIHQTVPGEIWDLRDAVFTGKVFFQAPDVVVRGRAKFLYVEQQGDRLTLAGANPGDLMFRGNASGMAQQFIMRGADGLQMVNADFRDAHETFIRFEIGPGGKTCHNWAVLSSAFLHNGTPSNGKGYSTWAAARPAGDVATGPKHGPGVMKDFAVDCGIYGHYGAEIWDTRGLQILTGTFKGKGGNNGAENGFMSNPRCDNMLVRGVTFDMRQGCWRVMEVVEMNDLQFIENTVYGFGPTFGDTLPMSGGSSGRCSRHTIQRNRVRDIKLFAGLAGDGHVISDNRLTNVAIERNGSATNVSWTRNGPLYGPAWA